MLVHTTTRRGTTSSHCRVNTRSCTARNDSTAARVKRNEYSVHRVKRSRFWFYTDRSRVNRDESAVIRFRRL